MWEKIETWHWTILVAVISVLSVLLFQQQVLAQWNPPDDSPGSTSLNHIVVTPMEEDLNLSGYKINDPSADAVFYIDPSDATDIRAAKANFNELCIAGVCNTTWPSGSSGFTSLWSTSTINEDNIYYSGGNVGIGTNDPESALHIYSNTVNGSDIRLLNTTGDMSIIFQEYEGSPSDIGDFFITYNGGSGGFANWLEFYGKPGPPSNDDGRPVMTMQRDYVAAENTYKGVGIGVPSGTNISSKLRVQNYGTEDILQLYDGSDMKFVVSDGGYVGINGLYHDAVPLFVRSGSTSGLKVYTNGIYSWNLSNLELKATNDVYLNPGLYDGVGIEVSDPQQILHVKNPASSFPDALIRLENNNDGVSFSNQTTQVEFARGPNWSTDYSWIGPTDDNTFDVWTMEDVPMLFGVNGNELMKLHDSFSVVMKRGGAWDGNGGMLNVKGYGNSGIYVEGNPGILALADSSSKQAGFFSGDVHIQQKVGDDDSGFLVLNGYSAPLASSCDEAGEMGRIKFDKVNGRLYFCVGDPGNGVPGQWKSISL